MGQDILGIIIVHLWTMSCAAAGGILIYCAYLIAVGPDKRSPWMPLVVVLIAVTTALVISVIKGSIALSLGLIGALSVARFRTPISDPRQLVLILASIALGIGFGAGELLLTGVGAVAIAGLIVVFYTPRSAESSPAGMPKIVARLSFTGDAPVTIRSISEYLQNRHVTYRIRGMSKKENVTSITVHLLDCDLLQADRLTHDLADIFAANQCEFELQVKSAAETETAGNSGQDTENPSRSAFPGAVMIARIFGRTAR